jgi:hypothetical protein
LGLNRIKISAKFALIQWASIELKVCCPQCVAASRVLPNS